MKTKIAIVTNSRAEYGHVKWLMSDIQNDPDLELINIVMGGHLSADFGYTFKVLEADGFPIDEALETTLSADTPSGATKSMGLILISMADTLRRLKPDWLVILGDRYEMLASATAAHLAGVAIAHLHGGETTEGAIDEAMRHSITKMSILHFASTENHAKRVIQLGEQPNTVFNFGAPGLDSLHRTKLLSKAELEKEIDFQIDDKTALVTLHPVTLEKNSSMQALENLLGAMDSLEMKAVFTSSNADVEGRLINDKLQKMATAHPEKYKFIHSFGQLRYFSALKNFPLMIGNTSSGIIESGSFKIPVVNIGDRQKGREHGKNVLHSSTEMADIKHSIQKALSPEFKSSLKDCVNPYAGSDDGKNSLRIKEKIKSFKLTDRSFKKIFYDIK